VRHWLEENVWNLWELMLSEIVTKRIFILKTAKKLVILNTIATQDIVDQDPSTQVTANFSAIADQVRWTVRSQDMNQERNFTLIQEQEEDQDVVLQIEDDRRIDIRVKILLKDLQLREIMESLM